MSDIESFANNARAVEREIERWGIVLGIDWTDEPRVRALAREALTHDWGAQKTARQRRDWEALAKFELFGLAALMLKTMEGSAEAGYLTHGGTAWKAFARALWAESGQSDGNTNF